MKKFLTLLPLLFFILCAGAQQLGQITFSGASALSYFTFITDQGVLIRISQDGNIMEWGTELRSERSDNYFAPKLQTYPGRVDYYGPEADTISRGKVKSIGTCVITYYGPLETDIKKGKVKSIGSAGLDYYTHFENAAFKGKLKLAGKYILEYYSSFEDEALRGKLKAVSNARIIYHSSFDDKLVKGKIKSIGNIAYNWGTSLDPKGQGGSLKSGSYRQNINGVTYILR